MHAWLVFLHVLAVFGFLISHGISATSAFALVRERELTRVQLLLELSANSFPVMYISLLLIVLTGVIAGFTGKWWGDGWIWTSLGLLIAIIVAMERLGSRVYGGGRKAAGLPYFERGKNQPPLEPVSQAEIDAILARGKPVLLTVIGYGGLAVIAWLMVFKPF